MEAGANMNVQDKHGRTALMLVYLPISGVNSLKIIS